LLVHRPEVASPDHASRPRSRTDNDEKQPHMSISSLIPAPGHPLLKAAGLVHRRGLKGTLRHARVVLMHKAHIALERRAGEIGPAGDADRIELADLTIASPNRDAGVHYLPTPRRVLDWIAEALPEPDRQWSFVDLGCGKGRALVAAAQRPYGRVIGVEFAAELAAGARAALAEAEPLQAGHIEVHEGDAAGFVMPPTPIVLFLFNPFGSPVIEQVAWRLSASYRNLPRPIVVAYLNPEHAQVFDTLWGFSPVALPRRLEMKLRLLSPYALRIYATPEARAHL
jgi:SAM-dependent methyltransferase